MDTHELSRILIKIAGISIIIFVLVGIPSYISYYYSLQLKEDSVVSFFLISILPMIIPLLAGYLMWQFPNTIANKIIKPDTEEKPTDSKLGLEIQTIAFSVLGIYLLFNAFSDVIYHLSYYYKTMKASGTGYMEISTYAFIVATCAEIIFASVLLFGGKGVAEFLRKIRRS